MEENAEERCCGAASSAALPIRRDAMPWKIRDACEMENPDVDDDDVGAVEMATVAPALRILAAALVSRGKEREAVAMDPSEVGDQGLRQAGHGLGERDEGEKRGRRRARRAQP